MPDHLSFPQNPDSINSKGKAASFVKAAIVLALARNNPSEAREIARRRGVSANTEDFLRAKAADIAATGIADWGGALGTGAAADFISAIRPASVFYQIAAAANSLPFRQPGILFGLLPTPGAADEATWMPVLSGTMSRAVLNPVAVPAMVVASKEFLETDDPAAFSALSLELRKAVIAGVDRAFLSVAQNGVTAVPAMGDDDLTDAIRAALDTVAETGAERLFWVAGARAANHFATAADLAGALLFPEMGPSGGRMVNIPALVTSELPAGRVLLIDASGFCTNSGFLDVRGSRQADVQISATPGDGAAQVVSLFQNNLEAIRAIATIGAIKTRANAVAAFDIEGIS